jgi:hypothetical protein
MGFKRKFVSKFYGYYQSPFSRDNFVVTNGCIVGIYVPILEVSFIFENPEPM